MIFRIIDIETTGLAPPAEIIEVGCVDVTFSGTIQIGLPKAQLFRPLRDIPPETKAVHHLTEADFDETTPVCTEEELEAFIWSGAEPVAFVAHNCEFEQSFISDAITRGLPWICTHKAALRVWPDAPRHSNQVLRYWRGHMLDATYAMPPHRAGPDAWVTAHILGELLASASTDSLIEWTTKPRLLPKLEFGKHRGSRWADIPTDYLQWMSRQSDMNADAVACAKEELARRTRP